MGGAGGRRRWRGRGFAALLLAMSPVLGQAEGPLVPLGPADGRPRPEPPKEADQPEATSTLGEDQLELSAEYVRRDEREKTIFAEGGLNLRWRDLTITGQRAMIDWGADKAHVEGPIRATKTDGTVFETDVFDLDLAKYWYTTGAFTAVLPPSVVGRGAQEPLYLRGADTFSMRQSYFSGHKVIFSTCLPGDEKYKITARTIAVVPRRKIILRSAKVYLFGVPIFAFGKMVIPLRRYRRTEWLPEFGRNDVYGFYSRMRYFYDFADSQYGDVSGMITEKRGTFLGFEHDYGYGRGDFRGQGRLDVQYGSRNSELTVRGDLSQGLGEATNFRLNGSFSRNSGFSSTTSQSNVTGNLTHRFSVGDTSLGYSRSDTVSGAFSSSFTRLNLAQRFNLGPIFGAELNADLSGRSSSSQESDYELETRFKFNGQWTLFDWELQDQRRFDLEGSRFAADDNRSVTEIVPQLTLRTDTRRLGMPGNDLFNLRLDTSVGQFREFVLNPDNTQSRSTVLRVNFDAGGDLARVALGPKLRFYSSTRYSQSFFDHPNPAAKYIVAVGPTLEWTPFQNVRLDGRYRWQEVAGFSPLQRFDFAQTLNDFDYTANFFLPDRIRPRTGRLALTLNGGYDLLRGEHRDLRIGLQAQPVDPLMINLNTSYALSGLGFQGAGLRSIRGEVIYDGGRRWKQEVGFTYDPRNGRLQNLDSLLTIEPINRLTIQNALTYDGFRKKISFNDILVNYDLGCVALVGTYRQEVHEFTLDLHITAFPGLTSLFGTGKFGQQFSTSQGFQF